MGEGHKKLNFSDCMGLAIGQIIGSGIMVLTGIVIGLTGHGIAAAFILGAVLAIITCVPFIILTSAIPSSGAGFTYIRRLMGEKAGFMYIAMFVLSQVLIATYAKGFASYFCSIFPQFGESAVAMAALVICTAVNLIGLKSSALVQKVTNLNVHKYIAGHLGGEQQLGSQIENNDIDMVIFLRDPLHPKAHEPDINNIFLLCDMHNIPLATNLATAELLIKALDRGDLDWREFYK